MVRCPTCHRRLAPARPCPRDGAFPPRAVGATSTSSPPDVPGFTISKLLGTGGFGSVWEATAEGGASVAVKVGHGADPASVLRVEHEAEALTRVGPPHVPRFYA